MSTANNVRPRKTARRRAVQRVRILVPRQGGFKYGSIGRAEGLTRDRIRQIVVEGIDEEAGGRIDTRRLTAGRVVFPERFEAVDKLVKAVDRFDTQNLMCRTMPATEPREPGSCTTAS